MIRTGDTLDKYHWSASNSALSHPQLVKFVSCSGRAGTPVAEPGATLVESVIDDMFWAALSSLLAMTQPTLTAVDL